MARSRDIGGGNAGNPVTITCVPDSTFATEITALIAAGTKVVGKYVAGVTSGNYTTGNYIRDTATPANYAYILDAKTILAGQNELILVDFSNTFTSATNYEEVDKSFTPTGVTSTGFNFGTLNNEMELYYGDKDEADLQMVVSITHNNSNQNSEVQFIVLYDTGSGYTQDPSTQISTTNPKQTPRSNTSTISSLHRFVKGHLMKIQIRYVDVTTSVVDNITITRRIRMSKEISDAHF